MDQLRSFRVPAAIGASTIIVVLVVLLVWISPEGGKLAAAKTTQSSLVTKEATLQGEVDGLRADKDKAPTNCGDLVKVNTEIPGAPDQAQFITELSMLAHNSGNPGTPTLTWGGGAAAPSAPAKGAPAAAITSIPFTLTLGGTYEQLLTFLDGIQTFAAINRLVTVSSISITGGGTNGAEIADGPSLAPLSQIGYSLTISGDVYVNPALSEACDSLVATATPTTLSSVPPTTFPTPSTLPPGTQS